MKEKQDDLLKNESKEWWSQHSQDYVSPGSTDHLGVPQDMEDAEFREYLNVIDRNFGLDAYFAQKRGAALFSGLIPESLHGKKVLEIGCGLGAHTERLCSVGAEVTSIDISETSVHVTKRRLELKGLFGTVEQADAESLPFGDAEFDFIWSWGVIHHSPNTQACAEEISRVLKPGGELRIMLYHSTSFYNWVNVILRYGILQGKLLHMSVQDLHNRYTDGKKIGGAPLAKYYSRKEVARTLFPSLVIRSQISYEQKNVISTFVPARYRRAFEGWIPDRAYGSLWRVFGFLLVTVAQKPQ